ncbi:hypothetical protein WUBG_08101 [Wuchereria bancrofti]|uniref:Uncharacterized protein n=1 Tax=Wuchereria bancrofti TaxID=6293 RepID=J9EEV8_WUCBA|nr:hypothetical protein WUBG_08101 [Wuchereria bancrofti]
MEPIPEEDHDLTSFSPAPEEKKLLSVFVVGGMRDGTGGFNRIKPDDGLGLDGPSAVFATTRNSYSPFGFKFSTAKPNGS